jgi:hypothetical protein
MRYLERKLVIKNNKMNLKDAMGKLAGSYSKTKKSQVASAGITNLTETYKKMYDEYKSRGELDWNTPGRKQFIVDTAYGKISIGSWDHKIPGYKAPVKGSPQVSGLSAKDQAAVDAAYKQGMGK